MTNLIKDLYIKNLIMILYLLHYLCINLYIDIKLYDDTCLKISIYNYYFW